MMIPLVTRTTEEMIRVGARRRCARRRWRSAIRAGARRSPIVLRTALPGIVTGALVAIARIAGETAPLLFTAFGNHSGRRELDAADRRLAAADLSVTRSARTTSGIARPGRARSS